ncbi:MAG: GC-type dockerin domain-anchored protein, partial [Phycisphaerales bacterium JB039]
AFGDDRLLVGGGAGLISAAPVAGSSAWTLEARIDGPGPYFAARVAMTTGGDGAERAFIIAPNDTPGSVIIMRREPGGWVEEARISGYAEPFAQNVAADGDTVAVIGDASFAGGGTAYIFEREGAEWVLTSELSEQLFLLSPYGVAMDLRGDVLAISVSRTATDPLPEDPHGRVFVYRREGGRWAREAVINEDGSRGDWYFAQSLSFAGEWLAVESTGEIQMYMPRDGDWEYVGRFWAPVPYGGTSVAGARDAPARIVVGEPYTSRRTGAAYVFSLAACFCRADLSGDGKLDIFDVLMFLSLFDAGDLRADFDESGALDIFDFLAFQNAFAAGCP